MSRPLPLAVYYGHPEWFQPLFVELIRRSIDYVPIDAGPQGCEHDDDLHTRDEAAWNRGQKSSRSREIKWTEQLCGTDRFKPKSNAAVPGSGTSLC